MKISIEQLPSRLRRKNNINPPLAASRENYIANALQNSRLTSIYDMKNINFSYYLQFCGINRQIDEGFFKTVDENYFQLPEVTLDDGSTYCFEPDESQLECAKKLYQGDNLVFIAPTGTGKTAIANWIITNNLKNNKRTFIPMPLIALENDKFQEFQKLYGEENVGLLTGERKINPDAPIVIMTAEIYNMQASSLYKNPEKIGTVVFDEAHYLSNEDRGSIWEKAIIKTPPEIQLCCLSATVGNGSQLTSWIQSLSSKRGVSKVELPPCERHVPLVWHGYIPDENGGEIQNLYTSEIDLNLIDENNLKNKQKRALEIIFKSQNKDVSKYYKLSDEEYRNTALSLKRAFWEGDEVPFDEEIDKFFNDDFKEILSLIYPNLTKSELDETAELLTDASDKTLNPIPIPYQKSNYAKFIADLDKQDLLPALIFKLSKKRAEGIIESLKEEDVDLTSDDEKAQILEIIEKYQQEGKYFGKNFDKEALLKGYAFHHSGIIPAYKQLIEELFSKKLLKTVSATSTLSVGINMPARTVVVSDCGYRKYNNSSKCIENVFLTPNEFHQMAGRAGRRGIDNIGHVVLYNLKSFKDPSSRNADNKERFKNSDELGMAYQLMASEADNLRSRFKPDWVSVANYWLDNKTDEELKNLVNKSFKVFLSKNPQKEEAGLLKKFDAYKAVLLKTGFLEENKRKETVKVTPKGRLLAMSQGINPVILNELIYKKVLKAADALQLCQIAGMIAGSDPQDENIAIDDIINKKLKQYLGLKAKDAEFINFSNLKTAAKEAEKSFLPPMLQNRINYDDILKISSFSGYITYLWASLNEIYPGFEIQNFEKLTQKIDAADNSVDLSLEEKEARAVLDDYNRKAAEGNVYKILAQSVTVLKTIVQICDFALLAPELYPDSEYYQNLKNESIKAIEMIEKKPVFCEKNV